jgi:hypothetical protein
MNIETRDLYGKACMSTANQGVTDESSRKDPAASQTLVSRRNRESEGRTRMIGARRLNMGTTRSHRVEGRRRAVSTSALISLVAVLALVFAGSADAGQQLQVKETFGSAGQPTFTNPEALAVDQSSGDLLVMDAGNGTISRWNPDGTPANFSALGGNVIDAELGPGGKPCGEEPSSCDAPTPPAPEGFTFYGAGEVQIAVDNSGTATDGDIYVTLSAPKVVYIFAKTGKYLGELTEGSGGPFSEACGVAVDSTGSVYVDTYLQTGGVQKFTPSGNPVADTDFVTSFPEPANPCPLAVGAGPTASFLFVTKFGGHIYKINAATQAIAYEFAEFVTTEAVDPTSGNVLVAHVKEITEYDASGATQAVEQSSFGLATLVQGVAVASTGAVYVARAGTPQLEVLANVTVPTVTAGTATQIGPTEATLNGSINPEGTTLTGCKIEYGPTGEDLEHEASCNPSAADIPADSSVHPVSATVAGLQPETAYSFRVTATTPQATKSSSLGSFSTSLQPGPARITAVGASGAEQGSVTLEAKIDPHGFDTSYHFEWGPTASYGNSTPAGLVGTGEGPRRVTAKLEGLSLGSVYHFKLVAGSSAGSSSQSDHIFETLDSCGLPEQRCFELVSPPDVGPTALPGEAHTGVELHFQATPEPGSLAYVAESGFSDATKGAEVLYHATRGASGGWVSSQLSAPFIGVNETASGVSTSSTILGLSENLSCGVLSSNQPLTSDAGPRLLRQAGGSNLYRRNPDGSYTAITALPPENLDAATGFFEYNLEGFSGDCGKVVFTTEFHYPGVDGIGQAPLYEWNGSTLKSVGWVPGPGGPEAVEATLGGGQDNTNAVSADGSRVFFTGGGGIWVRENGTTSRELTVSETSTPVTAYQYQYATKSGSRVFFTANAGLTDVSSTEGEDLYEYNLEDNKLTDLTVDHNTGGAAVRGFLGASEDGSHVYFIARGRLVPGVGRTFAQNKSADTFSVYGEQGGVVGYVGMVADNPSELNEVTVERGLGETTSRVSPDGRYLLFQTAANVTGYEPGHHTNEAYLYDVDAQSEPTVCVSCRQDGETPVTPNQNRPIRPEGATNPLFAIRALSEREGRAEVYFDSYDSLAPGATAGLDNIYEWSHGQVFLITTEPPGLASALHEETPYGYKLVKAEEHIRFVGASADGTDLYFSTTKTLNWEDGDERSSVYDARVGGGFPEPAPPAPLCDPLTEGSCPGATVLPAAAPGAASASFTGPGNALSPAPVASPPRHPTVKPKKKKKQKKRKKQNKKKLKKGKKRQGKKAAKPMHARNANSNRGASK